MNIDNRTGALGLLVVLGILCAVPALTVPVGGALKAATVLAAVIATIVAVLYSPFWLLAALFCVVPLNALFVSSASQYVTLTKLLALPLAVGTAWRQMSTGDGLRFPVQSRYVLAFAAVLLTSSLLMKHAGSVEEWGGATGGGRGLWYLHRYAGVLLLYFLTIQVVRTREQVRILLVGFVAACLVSSGYGLVRFLMTGASWHHAVLGAKLAVQNSAHQRWAHRLSGMSLMDPNEFAAQVVAAFFVLAVLAMKARRRLHSFLFLLPLPLCLTTIFFAYSRGATLGLVVGTVLIVWLLRDRIAILPATCGIGLIAVTFWLAAPEEYVLRLQRMLGGGGYVLDASLRHRLEFHMLGLRLLAEGPLVGLGPHNFDYLHSLPVYRFVVDSFAGQRRMHNAYFGFLLDVGILGFVPIMLVVVESFRSMLAARRSEMQSGRGSPWPEALLVACTGYFVCQCFLGGQTSKVLWVLLALGPCLNLALAGETQGVAVGGAERNACDGC